MKEMFIKKSNNNFETELKTINFDSSYINVAKNKYISNSFKIFNLKPHEANILKQLCLSLGFDCAVSRDTIMCKCEYTNAMISASKSQLLKLIDKLKKQPFRLKELSNLLVEILKTEKQPIVINNDIFDWSKPYIMGILNVTPDSFSDGGEAYSIEKALQKTIQLIHDGADIIDIGGESTRPNAQVISVEEEISRVIPVIKKIRELNISITISVDTRNYLTAKLAIEAGANIINDVSGLDYDPLLFDYVAKNDIPVIIMHSDKVPANSKDIETNDIIEEVYYSLYKKIEKLLSNGHSKNNIIIDVGIGFGKSQQTNFELLKRIDEFSSLGVPMLLGISRKSFIRNEFGLTCEEADIPTAMYSAMLKSVDIHRVHNVVLTKKYLDFSNKLR